MTDDNPLVSLEFPLSFDRIAAEHVEPGVRALLDDARRRLDALASTTGERTYDSTLSALEGVTERLDLAMNVVEHLEGVATSPDLRAAFAAVQPEVSAFMTSIPLSEGLWSSLRSFAATPTAAALTGTRRRFLDKTIADFKRSGADLDAAGKRRMTEIDVELATLTLRFGQNVLDSTNAFDVLVDEAAALRGLPPAQIDAARQSAAEKKLRGLRLTLQAPSYVPAMTYLEDGRLRERLYRASGTRAAEPGEHDNRPLVRRIIELRCEKAALLGYASFADLVCEDRMAKTGDAAWRFVHTLRERAVPFFERENQELLAFRREIEGSAAPPLAPWDVAFYAEKLRRARFDFDEEELRPYLMLERALDGVFAVAERLYGVRVVPWPDAPRWDPTVRAFQLVEPDGTPSARFYVDVFPRETKRDGAWMHGIHLAPVGSGEHVEILVANFSPPVGDRPALLRHRELETLFHEFGHLLHHASSKVAVRTLGGTNVARDFVELPSQIMENWCWEREALDLFARHHETGASLPDGIFQRMRAARSFRAANVMMRQLGFAELDLALHRGPLDPGVDVVAMARTILGRYAAARLPDDYAMVCSFAHLFASSFGYAAGYYSYKWAEVLEADAFSRFRTEGIFSRDVGAAFRAHVLSQGDSVDPGELFRRFMGRDPRLDALLERDGLIAA